MNRDNLTRDERLAATRAALATKGACDDDQCPGWAIMNGDEIQRCDTCAPVDVTDDDVALLPEAQTALELESGEVPCPGCGSVKHWRADYYEATHQGVTLVRRDGEHGPAGVMVEDYTGEDYGHYDDGDTPDEAYRCTNCDHTFTRGTFTFIDVDEADRAGTPLDGCRRALAVLEWGDITQADPVIALLRSILHTAEARGELPAAGTPA